MTQLIDLTGHKFERLFVIERKGTNRDGRATWRCRCDCGRIHIVSGCVLTRGDAKSCGCLRVEQTKRTKTTHGGRATRLYSTWSSMLARCRTPTCHAFKHYGGRGITVHEPWQRFELFRAWALKSGYQDTLSIDRIDHNGNYVPENCQWVTRGENTSRRNRTQKGISKKRR